MLSHLHKAEMMTKCVIYLKKKKKVIIYYLFILFPW